MSGGASAATPVGLCALLSLRAWSRPPWPLDLGDTEQGFAVVVGGLVTERHLLGTNTKHPADLDDVAPGLQEQPDELSHPCLGWLYVNPGETRCLFDRLSAFRDSDQKGFRGHPTNYNRC